MSPHGHWDRDLSQAKWSLDKAQALLSEAKKVGALFRPPAEDEKRRPWMAMACWTLDVEVVLALARGAGAQAFCFGPSESCWAANAASVGAAGPASELAQERWRTRPLSAWHLALMSASGRARQREEGRALVELLEMLPASREAAKVSPCPDAVACAAPTLAQIKAWRQGMPAALESSEGGPNLAQCLAGSGQRELWRVCMRLAKGPKPLRDQLRQGSPSALDILRKEVKAWGGAAWAQAVEKMAADLEASDIAAASKRTKAASRTRSL